MKDNHVPRGRWEFDESVTACFEDMLARSIPGYWMMRNLVQIFASDHLRRIGGSVCDLGSSKGDSVVGLIDDFPLCDFTLLEISKPMVESLRERFAGKGNVVVKEYDLRNLSADRKLPCVRPLSLVLSVLTVQFVPIEYRQRIFQACFDALQPGGMMILVEKVLGSDFQSDQLFVSRYLDMKAANGYTAEQIETKRKALEGQLVPVKAAWNEELLHKSGFRSVECFWRCLNFAAWEATK